MANINTTMKLILLKLKIQMKCHLKINVPTSHLANSTNSINPKIVCLPYIWILPPYHYTMMNSSFWLKTAPQNSILLVSAKQASINNHMLHLTFLGSHTMTVLQREEKVFPDFIFQINLTLNLGDLRIYKKTWNWISVCWDCLWEKEKHDSWKHLQTSKNESWRISHSKSFG